MKPLGIALAVSIALVAAVSAAPEPQDQFKRESAGNAKKQAALEGKKPPKFKVESWQNIAKTPKSWADLKGKVVLLDFWAYW